MKQWINKIILFVLIILLSTIPASAKICTTTLLYCGDGTNNCNKVACSNDSVYNGTFATEISKLYFNDSSPVLMPEANISSTVVVYFNPHLQWQFDYWSFFIGMVIMYSIYTMVIILYLEKKKHA